MNKVPNALDLIRARGFQGRVQITFLELLCDFFTLQNKKHLLVVVLEKIRLKSGLSLTWESQKENSCNLTEIYFAPVIKLQQHSWNNCIMPL